MKKMYLFMFAFALIASAYGQETTNLEKEKEAIKAVILEETQSFFDRDFERYAATYKYDESIVDLRAYNASYSHVVGWEENSSGTKYLGKYEIQPGFILEILLEDSQLYAHPTGQQKMQLFAYEENKFFLKTVVAQLEFNFEEDEVVSLTLHQNGDHTALKVE
jgi:hypothetical protein